MSPDQGPVTLVLFTDSFLSGAGLAALLAERDDAKVLGQAQDPGELVALVDELAPEVVVLTVGSAHADAMANIEAASQLRDAHPDLGILIISDRGNGFAVELLRGGASRIAYLLDEHISGIDTVIHALQEIRAGQTVLDPSIVEALMDRRDGVSVDDLTTRELDVLEQIAHGLSNGAIAAALNVSVKAVEKNITTIFRKLGIAEQHLVDRRVTAALTYLRAQTSPFSREQPRTTH